MAGNNGETDDEDDQEAAFASDTGKGAIIDVCMF